MYSYSFYLSNESLNGILLSATDYLIIQIHFRNAILSRIVDLIVDNIQKTLK